MKRRSRCSRLLEITKDYFDKSSIHGLRYVMEKRRNIIERFFWIFALAFSLYGTYKVTKSLYESYEKRPISFAMETNYLHWNTQFPAVSICERDSDDMDTTYDYVFENDPAKADDFNYLGFVNSVVFPEGQCAECKYYCVNNSLCGFNYKEMLHNVSTPCEELIADCKWNGQHFNCCSKVTLLESEIGWCNSMNTRQTAALPPLMISNKHTGPGVLELVINKPANVYIHSREGTPYLNIKNNHFMRMKDPKDCTMLFKVVEMENDPLLKHVSLDRRGCRFPGENPLSMYAYYSYSACITECRAHNQKRLCGCMLHILPNTGNSSCDARGMECVYSKKEELNAFRTEGYTLKSGIVCNCSSSCDEPEIDVVYNECSRTRSKVSYVKIKMVSLPVERYKRKLIRSKLDLVVSIGGVAGFFLGASLLSAAEIFIYFCIRPFWRA